MENVKDWLDKKGYYNSGLRTDINHRIDLYLSDVLDEYRTEQLRLGGVGSSLPDLQKCNQASLDYATKKDNPDFFLIKQTFKEGINWALNYMTKPK